MDTSKVYMVRSAKGQDMLCVDSFLYHFEDRGLTSYRWVCNKRKDKLLPCRSRMMTITVEGDETKHLVRKVVGDHTHDKCSADEVFKAFERKRIANLAGDPGTLENKSLKRKMKRIEEFEESSHKKLKKANNSWDNFESNNDDEDEDEDKGQVAAVAIKKENLNLTASEVPKFNLKAQTLYMLKTSYGRQMICLDGFLYRLEGKSKTTPTYRWECVRRRIPCKAHLVTELTSNGHHVLYNAANRRTAKIAHEHEPYTTDKLYKLINERSISILKAQEAEEEYRELPRTSKQAKTVKRNLKSEDDDDDDEDEVGAFFDMIMSGCEDNEEEGPSTAISKLKQQKMKSSAPKPSAKTKPNLRQVPAYKLTEDPLSSLKAAGRQELNMSKFSFLPSAKGNKVLCLDNYIYHFDSNSPRNGRSYWTCALRRSKDYKCNGRVTSQMTEDGPVIVKVSGRHLHSDSTTDIKRRLYKDVVAKNASDPHLKPSEVLKSSMNELGDDFREIVAKSKESIERRIGRLRWKMRNSATKNYNEQINDDSTSSFSSVLDSDDDHFDDNSFNDNLPNNIEEMRTKVEPTDELEMKYLPKFETSFEAEEDKEAPMEEEYLEAPPAWNVVPDTTNYDYGTDSDAAIEAIEEDVDVKPKGKRRVGGGRKPKIDLDELAEADMDITKISKLRSAKGGDLLVVDGYIYHHKSIQNHRTYWTCIKCKDREIACKSRVATLIDEHDGSIHIFKVTNHHSHPVNEHDIKRRLLNTYMGQGADVQLKKEILEKPLNEISAEYAEIISNSMSRQTNNTAIDRVEGSIMKLYAVSDGPPSLAVRMTLAALQIPYELVNVDFIAGEHMTEEYAEMNPQKQIPVLDDNGFYLPESIVIQQYLCDKYGDSGDEGTELYPKDATKRAVINLRLCFNMDFYYSSISAHVMAPIFFDYQRSEMSLKKVNNSLGVFETYLRKGDTKYAAGEQLTIADLALVSATLCLEAINFDLSAFPLVKRWYATFKREYPALWEIARGGMQEIAEFEQNPPDMSHMNHPFHPTRKTAE